MTNNFDRTDPSFFVRENEESKEQIKIIKNEERLTRTSECKKLIKFSCVD
jgi:hypothetical protein